MTKYKLCYFISPIRRKDNRRARANKCRARKLERQFKQLIRMEAN